MNTVISFDLHDADSEQYAAAHKILAEYGFSRTASSDAGVLVPLPESTAIGTRLESATSFRDTVWKRFEAAGLNPKRIFVAKYSEAAWRANA